MSQTSSNASPTTYGTSPEVVKSPGVESLPDDDAKTLKGEEGDRDAYACSTGRGKSHGSSSVISSLETPTIFEAWEVISVRPTKELTSFKRVLGIPITTTYKDGKDGYAGVRPIPSYTQGELIQMAETAMEQWNHKTRRNIPSIFRQCCTLGLGGKSTRETYVQDLAKRLFELPNPLPSKLGALIDSRFVASNKTPHFHREWKIVLLQPIPGALADDAPLETNNTRKNKARFWNKYPEETQKYPFQKWLVILRGHNTVVSEQGFAAFSITTNPWIRVDAKVHQERQASDPLTS